MQKIFKFTYDVLMWLSSLTGFSYKEINIIVWFIIIPFSWALLIDKIIGKHYLKISFSTIIIITLLLINDFSSFSNWLFDKSADFLRGFEFLGIDYIASSVIICVIIPIAVYYILIKKAYFSKK